MSGQNDLAIEELVTRALAGENAAFTEIYARLAPVLLVRLRRILGNREEARDVLQTVFFQVFKKLDRFDRKRPLIAWVQGFAMNIVRRHLRGKKRGWWLRFDKPDAADAASARLASSPDHQSEEREMANRLYQAMEHLSVKHRVAFALHEIEGLSLAEIAEMLSVSPQAVGLQVKTARRQIEAILGLAETGTTVRSFESRTRA